MPFTKPVVAVCERYGPGRLPYANRRDVGAGYVMATVAGITTTVFILVTQLVGISTVMSSWYEPYDGPLLEQVIGMVATVPGGFIAGFVVWRVPRLRVWRGVPAGVAAMVLMYPASALLDIAVILPLQQLVAGPSAPLSEYFLFLMWAPFWAVSLGYGAFTTTFWLTLPLGALGGYIHETARKRAT
ncbi:hypothetical protein EGH25_09245 [Haladaptatus sp. F3-133]|uniref:Uncharacterized protein n=1 Tax=Halorutilus salinus TaxID=2487751 RepID=A0A9Q4GJ43_9EURY|nr:hypothetical protein [Halorutilus salinus]MCX2819533.1 hypothetical protein [Halorutilus salinus]